MKVIWGKNIKTGKIELVDKAIDQNKDYLSGEYQLAFGKDWIIWSGKKTDMCQRIIKMKKFFAQCSKWKKENKKYYNILLVICFIDGFILGVEVGVVVFGIIVLYK